MIQKIKQFIQSKHEDYILDLVSKCLLCAWAVGFFLILVGFVFGSQALMLFGICIGYCCSGWDRVMSYLTWRE